MKNAYRWMSSMPIAMFLAAAGCAGSPEHSERSDVGRATTHLDAALPVIAPPSNGIDGCEDHLARAEDYALTTDNLIAALDENGDLVCVDTAQAVVTELNEIGENGEADELERRIEVTVASKGDSPKQIWGGADTIFAEPTPIDGSDDNDGCPSDATPFDERPAKM